MIETVIYLIGMAGMFCAARLSEEPIVRAACLASVWPLVVIAGIYDAFFGSES